MRMQVPKQIYTLSHLKKLSRFKVFTISGDDDTAKVPVDSLVRCKDIVEAQQKASEFRNEVGGEVYTGIHKENDWSRTAYWEIGWHVVNRTGEYAVVW